MGADTLFGRIVPELSSRAGGALLECEVPLRCAGFAFLRAIKIRGGFRADTVEVDIVQDQTFRALETLLIGLAPEEGTAARDAESVPVEERSGVGA